MSNVAHTATAWIENAALKAKIEERDETIRQLRESLLPKKVLPKRLGLTRTEHDVLMALAGFPGRVKSRAEVILAVYGHDADPPNDGIVDVFVCKIRKKLKPYGFEIQNRNGFGYVISPEHAAALLAMPEDGGN